MAVCLGVAFWGTLAVDWFFEPSPLVRGIVLAAVGSVFVGVGWQRCTTWQSTPPCLLMCRCAAACSMPSAA